MINKKAFVSLGQWRCRVDFQGSKFEQGHIALLNNEVGFVRSALTSRRGQYYRNKNKHRKTGTGTGTKTKTGIGTGTKTKKEKQEQEQEQKHKQE